jgi:hypothetical protein
MRQSLIVGRWSPGKKMQISKSLFAVCALVTCLFAQDILSKRPTHVTLEPVAPVTVRETKPANAQIKFRIRDGFHVNSSKPNSELLIPTEVNVTAIPQVRPGKPVYPAGHDFALAFSPNEKLSVYSGAVTVAVPLMAAKPLQPGSYTLKGELRYQACDDRSCFPPKTLTLEIPVRIDKQ